MTIDRDLWQQSVTRFYAPRWLCPKCRQGHFVLVQKSVFFLPSSEGYARLSEDPEDRGNDLPLRFSSFAQCDNKACEETASIAGVGYERTVTGLGKPELFHEFFP